MEIICNELKSTTRFNTEDNIYTDYKNIIIIKVSCSGKEENIRYINQSSWGWDYTHKVNMYIDHTKQDFFSNFVKNAHRTVLVKLHFPNYFLSSCDFMFYNMKNNIEIKFQNFSGCTSTKYMFFNETKLEKLDLTTFDTSQITDMSGMFSGCSSLKNLDLSLFDTSEITDMSYMFASSISLEILNLSSFNTSKVTNMSGMFYNDYNDSSLKILDLSSFDTSQVTDMSGMFRNCSSLENLDLSLFETSQVTDMSYMFSGCSSLKNLDLSSFDTSEVTDISYMFNGCSSLKILNLSSFDTSQVTDMSCMFRNCSSLKNLDLSLFDTSQVRNMSNMFANCISLESLDVTTFNTSLVESFNRMFYHCNKLIFLNLSSFDTNSLEDIRYMLNLKNLNLLILSEKFFINENKLFNYSYYYRSYETFLTNECIEIIENGSNIKETKIKEILNKCINEIEILIDSNETEEIKFINYFSAEMNNKNTFKEITIEDISIFINGISEPITKKIKVKKDEKYIIKIIYHQFSYYKNYCDGMFLNINKIKRIKFYNFKCNSSKQMFRNCSSLETLDLSQFDTSNITNMSQMFANSTILNTIGDFKPNENTTMDEMFCNCRSLKNIDKSSFSPKAFYCSEEFPQEENVTSTYFIEELQTYVEKCENEYEYTIEENKTCVKSCENSGFPFTIFHNKTCTKTCPENLFTINSECLLNNPNETNKNEEKNISEEKKNFSCPENYYEFNSTCVENCPLNYYKTNKKKCAISDCLEKDLNENIFYIHEKNYQEFIGKNTCNNNNNDNNNYDYFIAEIYDSNFIFPEKYSNSLLNTKECEKILKQNYNISEKENLTIFKINYYYENSPPKMNYKIFYNSQNLNLTFCEKIPLKISIPVDFEKLGIDMVKLNRTLDSGYDIFNISSEFFNDICSTFSSENGTDVTLNDRITDYYPNVSLCYEGCQYDGYDRANNKINCVCDDNNNLNHKQIQNEVNNLFSKSNLKVLKCFYLNKNLKKLLKNYGNYVFLVCEFGEFILFFFVICKNYLPFFKKVVNINENNFYKRNYNRKKTMKNPPKKIFSIQLRNFHNISNELSQKNLLSSNSKNKISIYKESDFNENFSSKKSEKEKNIFQKTFSNEEINDLNYNDSIKYDKRGFWLMYYNFLQYSQLIIFTFITKTDFNLRAIKISLFLFSFIIYLTFNTLFFTDKTMSHIYKKGGSFDFIYNLPKVIFSSLCCGVINFILKFLSLLHKDIKMLNKIKDEKEKNNKLNKILKCYKCKIYIFYFLIMVLMLLFHVYVITFCSVYVNTQKHLIKSTLISFALSMVYPFGICFFTAVLRKLSLKCKSKILFYCSKFMQLF